MAVPYKKLETSEEYPDHPNVFKWPRLSLSRLSHHSKVPDRLRQSAEARVAEKSSDTFPVGRQYRRPLDFGLEAYYAPKMSGAEGQSRTNTGSPPNRFLSLTLVVLLHHTTSQVISFRNPNSGNSNCNFPILALFAFSLLPGGTTYSLPVYSFEIESGATTGHDGIAKSTSS